MTRHKTRQLSVDISRSRCAKGVEPHLVQVSVCDGGVQRVNRLQDVDGDDQTCIGTVGQLLWVPDAAIGSTALGLEVVRSTAMPSVMTDITLLTC